MNYIECPTCFARVGGEEKCCSHGSAPGARCVVCGAVRGPDDPRSWHCRGSARNPTVRLSCEDCPWRYDVPESEILFSGGIPRATRYPEHDCPGAGTLLERAGIDADMTCTAPGQNFVLRIT